MAGVEIMLPVALVVNGEVIDWKATMGEARAAVLAISKQTPEAEVRAIPLGLHRTAYGVRMNCLPKDNLPEAVWNDAWQAFHHFKHLLLHDRAITPEQWIERIRDCESTAKADGTIADHRPQAIRALRVAMCLDRVGASMRGAA